MNMKYNVSFACSRNDVSDTYQIRIKDTETMRK